LCWDHGFDGYRGKNQKTVSGIAMGLITDENGKFAFSPISLATKTTLAIWDFKEPEPEMVLRLLKWILSNGLSYEVMAQALEQARQGRMHILGKILEVIPEPRAEYKPNVPRLETIIIPKEFIGAVIGPGEKYPENQEETGTVIVIEEVGDTGVVQISATGKESIVQQWRV
jgi:polyribonucleotide nucleotidyltransferase